MPPNDEWAIRSGDLADSRGADASTIYRRSATPSPPRPTTASARRGRFLRMKLVPTPAGVILSILPRDRWKYIRHDVEKNIAASSELDHLSVHPWIDGCSKGSEEQRETLNPQESNRERCFRLWGPFWSIFPNAREDDGESCIDRRSSAQKT